MEIGKLKRRITIQIPTNVDDTLGGFTTTWSDHATVWAKAWTVSSSELVTDMKVNLVRIQKFCIRYRNPFLASWRIKWGTRYFNITSIDPDEDNRFLYLTVKEVV
jgi:SPP1 family predicted phage head-tail adaptor